VAQFLQKFPDADRQAMGNHLASHPESKNESVRSALNRAYQATKPKTAQPRPSKKTASKKTFTAHDVEAAYDAVTSKAGRR
jgi:hypothetical protein